MTSLKGNGVLNDRELDSLFHILFRLTKKLHFTCLYEGKPFGACGFPSQRENNVETFTFHDVIMEHMMVKNITLHWYNIV